VLKFKRQFRRLKVKLQKQILRIGLYEFLWVKSEVNFAAGKINLDDNLKKLSGIKHFLQFRSLSFLFRKIRRG